MRFLIRPLAFTLAGFIGSATVASAVIVFYNFELTPEQEVATNPVVSDGFGFAEVELNTETQFLSWNVTYQDLTTPLSAAHFHGPADFGVNAGVIINMFPDTGETSGSIIGSATISLEHQDIILDGLSYINLHTSENPGGEIRGQVIPEPRTYALIAGIVVLAGAVFMRNRRRRQ